MAGERIPVTLLTGFLGAGKTTLLNRLLQRPEMAGSAVLINEFGEIGLDHLLVEKLDEDAVLLQAGCLCCTIRGDLSAALGRLAQRPTRPLRVLIETTGLADPLPILQTLMAEPAVARDFVLDGVVTLVDAVHGLATIDRQAEALRQVAVADRLLLSKADLALPESLPLLRDRLRGINPGAGLETVALGEIDPTLLLGFGPFDPARKSPDLRLWLDAEGWTAPRPTHGHAHHGHDHAHHPHDPNRHGDGIEAFCLTYDHPLPWDGLASWLEMLSVTRGDSILRVKGVLDLQGQQRPVVIHGVQGTWHRPTLLPDWPAGQQRRSSLVFILRDLPRTVIEDGLAAFLQAAAP